MKHLPPPIHWGARAATGQTGQAKAFPGGTVVGHAPPPTKYQVTVTQPKAQASPFRSNSPAPGAFHQNGLRPATIQRMLKSNEVEEKKENTSSEEVKLKVYTNIYIVEKKDPSKSPKMIEILLKADAVAVKSEEMIRTVISSLYGDKYDKLIASFFSDDSQEVKSELSKILTLTADGIQSGGLDLIYGSVFPNTKYKSKKIEFSQSTVNKTRYTIHEATHCFANTKDFAYINEDLSYRKPSGSKMERPPKNDALNNADSIAVFVEMAASM